MHSRQASKMNLVIVFIALLTLSVLANSWLKSLAGANTQSASADAVISANNSQQQYRGNIRNIYIAKNGVWQKFRIFVLSKAPLRSTPPITDNLPAATQINRSFNTPETRFFNRPNSPLKPLLARHAVAQMAITQTAPRKPNTKLLSSFEL